MTIPSAISVNAPIGQGVVYHINDEKKHCAANIADLFSNSVTVVFGGPAPFARLDTEQAEQYERAAEEILALGVDKIIAIYAQDAFVCQKFRETISERTGTDYLRYYGDGDGFFIRAYDLCRDFTYQGLSVRSERWCAVVKNNIILYAEHDDYSVIEKTSVNNVIAWLKANEI